jgi:hypothetical protein
VPESEPEPEAGPLPEYVVEPPATPAPVVVPESEPEPEAGPLPDFVVEPSTQPEPPPAPPPSALEPEEEEDLGPLPDFVIDPNLPPELRPPPPPRREPKPEIALKLTVEVSPEPGADSTQPVSTELNFPSVTSFSISGDRRVERGDRRGSGSRRAAPPETGKAKRSSQPAEPGDEGSGTDWMAGLSNRLSAYSLADEDAQAQDDAEAPPADPADETTED